MAENPISDRIERLIHEYGERAFQFAYRLSGDIDEAKDLVQEAYRRLLERWKYYDPGQPLENWFFGILRNVFRDGRRKYHHNNVVSLDDPISIENGEKLSFADVLPDNGSDVSEFLEREETLALVRAVFKGLDYEYRAILALCDIEGMSYLEISRIMDMPMGTVRSRICRARRALKGQLIKKKGVRSWIV